MLNLQATGPIDRGGVGVPSPIAREWALTLLFLCVCALFLFADTAPAPIALWDESRNVVNALEMRGRGLGLVTTYGDVPDHWNSKPPLLIWLMTASVALFGPSEWALRLPSALAALGTILLVLLFTRRVTGSLGTALGAAAMLALSPGFYGIHGARTADYDALLTFLTTAYLFLLFRTLGERRPRPVPMAGAGLLIAAAVMTKSAAGLLPGVGVALYLVVTRRVKRLTTGRGVVAMAAVAAIPVLLFHALREAAAPGYLDAVLHNDTVGRVTQSIVGRDEAPWFYLFDLVTGWFFLGPLLLIAPLGVREVRGKARPLLLYCLCVAGPMLLILSIAVTKLPHYILPAYPMIAIASALLLRGVWRRYCAAARSRWAKRGLLIALSLPLVLLAVRAVHWRYVSLPTHLSNFEGRYGPLFSKLSGRGERAVTVWEPGFTLEGKPGYAPVLRSYQLMWRQRGLLVERGERGPLLASCDPRVAALLRARGPDIAGVPGCVAVRETPRSSPS